MGKLISVTDGSGVDVSSSAGHIANVNPLRYRGYYYDTETGFYYLNSRYYDPETGRFINADGVIGANQDLTSYNLYAYCGNNPINRADSDGQAWWHIALACVAVVALCAITIVAAPAVAAAAASIGIVTTASAVATTAATVGCLAIGIGLVSTGAAIAETMPKVTAPSWSKSKAKEKEEVIPSKPSRGGKTYYHVTTPENATLIKTTGIMTGSSWEGGHVFAWENKPSKYAIENSGAHQGVIISFKTNVSFVKDDGIKNPKVTKYNPVVSAVPGPITVWDRKYKCKERRICAL